VPKLLFVCSRNRCRSLTAEWTFRGVPGISVKSAGTESQARIKVTEGLLGWADTIFCMEKKHVDRLRDKFPEAVRQKALFCLNIPDDYEFMDPELVELLRGAVSEHVLLP
jgi:predicted protein tyrosine phosphatase